MVVLEKALPTSKRCVDTKGPSPTPKAFGGSVLPEFDHQLMNRPSPSVGATFSRSVPLAGL